MVKRVRAESACPLIGRVFSIAKLSSLLLLLIITTIASGAQVVSPNAGSAPSGPASNEVLSLTISEAINQAVRYNLGAIESEENTTVEPVISQRTTEQVVRLKNGEVNILRLLAEARPSIS